MRSRTRAPVCRGFLGWDNGRGLSVCDRKNRLRNDEESKTTIIDGAQPTKPIVAAISGEQGSWFVVFPIRPIVYPGFGIAFFQSAILGERKVAIVCVRGFDHPFDQSPICFLWFRENLLFSFNWLNSCLRLALGGCRRGQ
jgi:hypothetical protein